VPNVDRFVECASSFVELLEASPPDEAQQKDLDYLLSLGELFTLIPYGQLICEEAKLRELATDLLDQIFDVLVRDFSAYAVTLHGRASSTDAQQEWALGAIRKPVVKDERFEAVWAEVRGLAGTYEMQR
jgi:acyl-CoA dehydrogenase